MYFGEEGERLLRQREEAKKKYGDELRAQIAQNQQRFRTTASPHQKQGSPYKNQERGPRGGITSPSSQGKAAAQKQQQWRQQQQFASIREPLPDLPMVVAGASPDVVRFDNRLSRLESWIAQNRGFLTTASENVDRIQKFELPKLNDNFERLYDEIDKVGKSELTARLDPLEHERDELAQMITVQQSDNVMAISSLRETLNQLSTQLSDTRSQFSSLRNGINATFEDFKRAIGECSDTQEAMLRRVAQAETKSFQAEGGLGSTIAAIRHFENTSTDSMSQAYQQMNGLIAKSTRQIKQILASEADDRAKQATSLQKKLESINKQTISSLTNINASINEVASAFKKSLTELSESVRESLETTRNMTEQRHGELSSGIDELLAQTEKNFDAIQSGSVAQLARLNEETTKARAELEAALTTEFETRQRNESEFVKKYDNFKSLIVKEMQLQAEQMERITEKAKQDTIKKCEHDLMPIRKDLAQIIDESSNAASIPERAEMIERAVSILNAQLMGDVTAVRNLSNRVRSDVDRVRGDVEQAVEDFDERVRNLEKCRSGPDFMTQKEIEEMLQQLGFEYEGRIQEIEREIRNIRASLAQSRTPSSSASVRSRESGALLIDQLVQSSRSGVKADAQL